MNKRMAWLLIWLFLVGCLLLSREQVQAQQQEGKPQPGSGKSFFIAPLQQIFDISMSEIVELRRQNKAYEFDLTVSQETTREQKFKIEISALAQKGTWFMRAPVVPEAEIYLVQPEEAQEAETLLRRLAREIWQDENYFPVLASFAKIPLVYNLPPKLIIPALQDKPYLVQSKDDLLSNIAQQLYGNPALASFLADINGMLKPYELLPNMWFFVPKLKTKNHIVQPGESLTKIAEAEYGTDLAAHFLGFANGLNAADPPAVGQELILPEILESYTVQEKDQVEQIAQKIYGSTWGEVVIAQANNLQRNFVLQPGQTLVKPVLERQRYLVQEGDTLASIAFKHYQDMGAAGLLALLNNLGAQQAVAPGMRLWLPKVEKHNFSCAGWIRSEEPEFTLTDAPKRLKFFANIPPNLNVSGTYSALISIKPVIERAVGEGNVRSQAIPIYNSILILNIAGRRTIPVTADLNAIQTVKSVIEGEEYTVIGIGLENLGYNMVDVRKSRITLLQGGEGTGRGRNILFPAQPLGDGTIFVLPESQIFMETAYQSLPPGEYIAIAEVDIGTRRPLFREFPFQIGEGQTRTVRRAVSLSVETANDENILIFDGLRAGYKGTSWKTFVVANNEWNQRIKCEVSIVELPGIDLAQFGAKDAQGKSVFSILERLQSFELGPRASQNIRISLRDPKIQEGARYARVVIKAKLTAGETGQTASNEVLESERYLDLFEVSDAEPRIKLFGEYLKSALTQDGKLVLDFKVKNEGNIHLKPIVELKIVDGFDQVLVSERTLSSEFILPSEERVLTTRTNLINRETIQAGLHKVQITLSEGQKELITLAGEFTIPQDFIERLATEEEIELPQGRDGEIAPVGAPPSLGNPMPAEKQEKE